MKPEQIYEELKDLAEKHGITVSEQNFRKTGINVKSGLCKVKGKKIFIIDKHKTIPKKNVILISFLKKMQHEDVYVVPVVRELVSEQEGETGKASKPEKPL
jgi:hypothetical protein